MKTKLFLTILALGSLFSCQQNEQQETSNETIHFTLSIDNENSESALTSAGVNYAIGKSSFSKGEIISMAKASETFNPFIIGTDSYSWNNIKAPGYDAKLYAHYPAFPSELNGQRVLKGGEEYLFGVTETTTDLSNINLKFKRMTVPVVVLAEDGSPYEGEANISLRLRNSGVQNLRNGMIEITENAIKEEIKVNKLSEGFATNLIPQSISKGESIGTISMGGIKRTIIANKSLNLSAGDVMIITLIKATRQACQYGVIIDGNIPLRR